MTRELTANLALLQYGDSFFPSGAGSFSWGLEALVEAGAIKDEADIKSFVVGQLHARWANFDRSVVATAHTCHDDLSAVAAVDDQVEIRSACAELRSGSRRMGEAMVSVFRRLAFKEAEAYHDMIRRGEAHGHAGVVQGFLWAAAGLSLADVIALSAHTFSSALLGASLRLGCLTHVGAQRILTALRGEVDRIAQTPVPTLAEMAAFGTEAEIGAMRHARQHTRLFAN